MSCCSSGRRRAAGRRCGFTSGTAPPSRSATFSPAADRFADPRLADLPFVRRSSGGAALIHGDGDLTYSLTLPPGSPWQDGEPWLCRFHHLLQAVLLGWSVPARAVACGEEARLGPVLCFLDQTAGDLVANGTKVVGSAQRRMKGALSQHGSIRLTTSQYAPEVPGVREISGVELSPELLIEAVTRRFDEETGWRLVFTSWTQEDERRIAEIAATKYGSREWNEKR